MLVPTPNSLRPRSRLIPAVRRPRPSTSHTCVRPSAETPAAWWVMHGKPYMHGSPPCAGSADADDAAKPRRCNTPTMPRQGLACVASLARSDVQSPRRPQSAFDALFRLRTCSGLPLLCFPSAQFFYCKAEDDDHLNPSFEIGFRVWRFTQFECLV